MRNAQLIAWFALPLLGIGAGVFFADDRSPGGPPLAIETQTVVPLGPSQLPPFSLVDDRGRRFDRGRIEGHWSLVFLGYTSCPDVCPTTLSVLVPTMDRINEEFSDTQAFFVSIDPQRDSPRRMRTYLSRFDAPLVGVTGPEPSVRSFVEGLGGAMGRSAAGRVDHPTSIFVVDPSARVVAALLRPISPGRLARDFAAVRGAAP